MCMQSTNMHVEMPKQQSQCSRIGFSSANESLSRTMPSNFQAYNEVALQMCMNYLRARLLTASRMWCCRPGAYETTSFVAYSAYERRCYQQGHPQWSLGKRGPPNDAKPCNMACPRVCCADSSRKTTVDKPGCYSGYILIAV